MMGLPAVGSLYNGLKRPDSAPQDPAAAATTPEALVDLIEKRYRYARQAKATLLETWATCLAFYLGEQWRQWDSQQARLVRMDRFPSWRVLAVYNQIPGVIDIAGSKLSKGRDLPRARPDDANDPESQQQAQLGTHSLRSWWYRERFETTEYQANVNRILFGAAFFHLYWDPGRFAKVAVPDVLTGQTRNVPAPVGEACCEVLTVFDVFPEPVERWEDIGWTIIARRKPLKWFRDTFGKTGKEVTADKGDPEGAFAQLLPGAEFTTGDSPTPDGDGLATLKIYYERPCPDYPDGRTLYVAGKSVLFQQDALPLPHQGLEDPLPLKLFGYRYVPKRLWPKGLVEECLSPQRELNRGLGNLAEMMRVHRNIKWFAPKGSLTKPNSITSAPDEVVEYQGPQRPEQVPPPPLPAWIATYPEQQREELRAVAGQHEVSEGQVPGGVSAASAIALLQNADQVRLSAPSVYGRDGLEALFVHLLTVQNERYREPRAAPLPDRRGPGVTNATVQAGQLGGLDVIIELTDGSQDSDAVRGEQVNEWLAGLSQQDPRLQMPLLREMGRGWIADAIEGPLQEIQQEQQMMQQQQMAMQQQMQQQQLGAQQDQQGQEQQMQREQQGAQSQEAALQREHEQQMAQGQQAGQLLQTLLKPGPAGPQRPAAKGKK